MTKSKSWTASRPSTKAHKLNLHAENRVPYRIISLALYVAFLITVQPATSEEIETVRDVITVTASGIEVEASDEPASISVLDAEQLKNAPPGVSGVASMLRSVPGLQVSQMNAREMNVSSRQATGVLANDTLVLVDGKTVYLDFFGLVMWDLIPQDLRELKQIDVVRGAASSVWGPNAKSGVVNLVTKSPSELMGTSVRAGVGEGSTQYASGFHADVRDRTSFKFSLGYLEQDPFDRPTGVIPGTSTIYPDFKNDGIRQPRVSFRLDYAHDEKNLVLFEAGYSSTDGILHTGIGPFDIEEGTGLSSASIRWSRGSTRLKVYGNFLDGDSRNLLLPGLDLQPLLLSSKTVVRSAEFSTSADWFGRTETRFGTRVRESDFDLSILGRDEERLELGAHVQNHFKSDSLTLSAGVRADHFEELGTIFSPRLGIAWTLGERSTFRASYGQGYRSPTAVESFLDTAVVGQADIEPVLLAQAIAPGAPCEQVLSVCTPFTFSFPTELRGNSSLDGESSTSLEFGYDYRSGNMTAGFTIYRLKSDNPTEFITSAFYSSSNLPSGWPVFLASGPAVPVVPNRVLPSSARYRQFESIVNQGVETWLSFRVGSGFSGRASYTYHARPEARGTNEANLSLPPKHKVTAALNYSSTRWAANLSAQYVDRAFWTDVFDSRFHGFTRGNLTMDAAVALSFGRESRYTARLTGTNILDKRVNQHLFGDLIERRILFEIGASF